MSVLLAIFFIDELILGLYYKFSVLHFLPLILHLTPFNLSLFS